MKIRITKTTDWLQRERNVEVGHIFNVKKRGISEKRKGRLWFWIDVHNGKPTIIYDDECVIVSEVVESGFVRQLKEMLKQI